MHSEVRAIPVHPLPCSVEYDKFKFYFLKIKSFKKIIQSLDTRLKIKIPYANLDFDHF